MGGLSPLKIEALRMYAAKQGLRTDRQIAEALGISYQSYSRKINGHTDFSFKELCDLRDSLRLNKSQFYALFFER